MALPLAMAVPHEASLALPIADAPIVDAVPLVVPFVVMPLAVPLAAAPLAAEPQAPTSPRPVQVEMWRGLQENVVISPRGSRVHKLERTTPRGTRHVAEYSSPNGDRKEALQKMRLSAGSIAAQARKRRKAGVPARELARDSDRVPWGFHKGRWAANFGDEEVSDEELQELWVEGGGSGSFCPPAEAHMVQWELLQCECGECQPCKVRATQHRMQEMMAENAKFQEMMAENAKCESASRSGASLYGRGLEYTPQQVRAMQMQGGSSTSSGRGARIRWELFRSLGIAATGVETTDVRCSCRYCTPHITTVRTRSSTVTTV